MDMTKIGQDATRPKETTIILEARFIFDGLSGKRKRQTPKNRDLPRFFILKNAVRAALLGAPELLFAFATKKGAGYDHFFVGLRRP